MGEEEDKATWITDPKSSHSIQIVVLFPDWSMPSGSRSKFWHPIRVECPDTWLSSQWNEGKMKMKWAELLSLSWSQLCPLLNLITPSLPSVSSSSSSSILSSLPPPSPSSSSPSLHPWVISVLSHSVAHGDTLIWKRALTLVLMHIHTQTHAHTHQG